MSPNTTNRIGRAGVRDGVTLVVELGFAVVLFPIGTLLAATAGIRRLLDTLRTDGVPSAAMPDLPTFDGFTDLIGLPEIRDLESRFGA